MNSELYEKIDNLSGEQQRALKDLLDVFGPGINMMDIATILQTRPEIYKLMLLVKDFPDDVTELVKLTLELISKYDQILDKSSLTEDVKAKKHEEFSKSIFKQLEELIQLHKKSKASML